MDFIKNRILVCFAFAGIAFVGGIASLFVLDDKLFTVVLTALSTAAHLFVYSYMPIVSLKFTINFPFIIIVYFTNKQIRL